MGNWRAVHIVGTCDRRDLPLLHEAIDFRKYNYEVITEKEDTYLRDKFSVRMGPLCHTPSLCGLPLWPAENISVIGNCYERDYTIDQIKEQVDRLHFLCPSLKLKVHCGGEYEDRVCVATIVCSPGLNTHTTEKPEIESIPEPTEDQMRNSMMSAIANARRF